MPLRPCHALPARRRAVRLRAVLGARAASYLPSAQRLLACHQLPIQRFIAGAMDRQGHAATRREASAELSHKDIRRH